MSSPWDDNHNNAADDGQTSANTVNTLRVKSIADMARLAEHLPVRWAELPQMPFFAPMVGYGDEKLRAAVAMNVLETRWRGQRSLTPDEVQIVAAQAAKMTTTLAYEPPTALGLGFYLWQRGRADFRVPMFNLTSPQSPVDVDRFPFKTMPLLRGQAARNVWQAVRAMVYVSFAHVGLRILFLSYAFSVKSAELQTDPRLGNLRQSIRDAATARAAAQRQHPGQVLPGQILPQLGPPPASYNTSAGYSSEPSSSGVQSTPAANSDEAFGTSYADQTMPDGTPLSQTPRQSPAYQPPQQQTSVPYPLYGRRLPSSSQPTPPKADANGDFADIGDDGFDDEGYHDYNNNNNVDDASPVAPSDRNNDRWHQLQQQHQQSSGSAWQRLRSQATHDHGQPGSSSAATHAQAWSGAAARRSATASPSSSSSQPSSATQETLGGDREREQKEFDAMLERERRGEGDDNKGWRR